MCFISNNWLLFLSHLSTNEDLEEGDADVKDYFPTKRKKKAGVKRMMSRSTGLLCVCECVCMWANVKERK